MTHACCCRIGGRIGSNEAAVLPEDAPPGETALFNVLARSPETNDWIVLHSLAIASHVRQVEGEADFVVIVPGGGILVIEVKSHLDVECLPDGRWKLGGQAPTPRSPFKQGGEAMHSIRDYLTSKGVDLGSVPVLDAVWFTNVRARTKVPASPEWHYGSCSTRKTSGPVLSWPSSGS